MASVRTSKIALNRAFAPSTIPAHPPLGFAPCHPIPYNGDLRLHHPALDVPSDCHCRRRVLDVYRANVVQSMRPFGTRNHVENHCPLLHELINHCPLGDCLLCLHLRVGLLTNPPPHSDLYHLLSFRCVVSMANHKYSHALVLSHYQDSGLLSHDQRRRTPAKSAHLSRPRTTESRVISEVFSPINSPPTSSAAQDSYFKEKPTQSPQLPHHHLPSRVLSSQTSLDRSDSVVTQIHVPPCPASPPLEVQYADRPQKIGHNAALPSPFSEMADGRRSTRAIHEGSKPPALRQKRGESHNPGHSNYRAIPVHSDQLAQGPSFDTEDDSEQDGPVGSSDHGQGTARQLQQASSTRQTLDDRSHMPYQPDHRHYVIPDGSVNPGQHGLAKPAHDVGQMPSPWSRVPRPPLESAAIDVRRRPSYDRTFLREPGGEMATRSVSVDQKSSSRVRTQEIPQSTSNMPISLPRPSTAVDVRPGRLGKTDILQNHSDMTSSRPDYFSPKKSPHSTKPGLPTSPSEPSSPRHPAPLNVRVKSDHGQQSTEKPLPTLPSYPNPDPRARPLRYRTRGFASASRNSWTSRSSSRQENTTGTQIEPIRDMAPQQESFIRAEAATRAAGQDKAQWHIKIDDSEDSTNDQVSAKQPHYNETNPGISSPKAPPVVSTSHTNDHRKPLSRFSIPPTNSRSSSLPSTNNPSDPSSLPSTGTSSNRPSTQTTPPTSPSLASLFSFSSTLSAPTHFSKIPIYNKDMIVLPWDHDLKMGPSLFCTSPPPPLSPPSPGPSIDDATPPPISRVRPLETRKRKTSETKARPRSLSGPSSTRLASPPPPIPNQQQQIPHKQQQIPHQQQQIPHQQQQQHSRARLSFSSTRASISQLNSIPYAATTAGLPPIPTAEKVFVPPPQEEHMMDRKEKEVEKRRLRYFWQGGIGVREIFGLGRKSARPDAGFMRGIAGG